MRQNAKREFLKDFFRTLICTFTIWNKISTKVEAILATPNFEFA